MNRTRPRMLALIVAAGEGQRMGGGTPKQYRLLGGKSVLRRSVEAFVNHPQVDAVCVVIHPDHRALYDEATRGLRLLAPARGGETRQQSVANGVERLFKEFGAAQVLVHDAARCFVDDATISRVIDGLQHAPAVLPTVAVADTLKAVTPQGQVQHTIPREGVHAAQTPQGFDLQTLHTLHLNVDSATFTDDAALAEAAGIAVMQVEGSSDNSKLTTEADWHRAEMLMQQHYVTRIGTGYDVHRLIPQEGGRQLWLCGVAVPHSHALEGHSDADVGLHAITDAILGALALGDIGTHFPPSDPRWKNADSADFIAYCAEQLQQRGAVLDHIDLTLICEAPKIGSHRDVMRERIRDLLALPEEAVSVKATTNEGMGFVGRREGIAAQAVATIRTPIRAEK